MLSPLYDAVPITSYSVDVKIISKLLIGKNLERNGCGLIEVLCLRFREGTKDNYENVVRV